MSTASSEPRSSRPWRACRTRSTFLGDPTLGNVLAGLEVPALQDLGIDMSDVIADLPTAGGGPKGTITRSFRCGA